MRTISIDLKLLAELLDKGLSVKQIAIQIGQKSSLIRKRMREYGLRSKHKLRMTTEQRKHISEARYKWNRENPERLKEIMVKRSQSKNHSVPCEKLKEWLRSKEIAFVEEFPPLLHLNRYYFIDIAFPDKKIGIEVNGNQHYNPDGSLKSRYQERHDLIEANGWKLYEIHYSLCFKPDSLEEIISSILHSSTKVIFDYTTYRAYRSKRQRKYPKGDNSWRHLPRLSARKCGRPSPERLREMVWIKPITHLAKEFGVSANAVARWCLEAGVDTPPVRYWPRIKVGFSHEEALAPILPKGPRHSITSEILDIIVKMREAGNKWTQIARVVKFDRHTVKEAYDRNLVRLVEVAST